MVDMRNSSIFFVFNNVQNSFVTDCILCKKAQRIMFRKSKERLDVLKCCLINERKYFIHSTKIYYIYKIYILVQ